VALLSSLPDSAREAVSLSCRAHFGHRELVHLPEPAALGVLFPLAPVPAGTEKQLAQVCRGGLHAIRHG